MSERAVAAMAPPAVAWLRAWRAGAMRATVSSPCGRSIWALAAGRRDASSSTGWAHEGCVVRVGHCADRRAHTRERTHTFGGRRRDGSSVVVGEYGPRRWLTTSVVTLADSKVCMCLLARISDSRFLCHLFHGFHIVNHHQFHHPLNCNLGPALHQCHHIGS